MVQGAKYSLCKHNDLNPDPQHSHKSIVYQRVPTIPILWKVKKGRLPPGLSGQHDYYNR